MSIISREYSYNDIVIYLYLYWPKYRLLVSVFVRYSSFV